MMPGKANTEPGFQSCNQQDAYKDSNHPNADVIGKRDIHSVFKVLIYIMDDYANIKNYKPARKQIV